MSSPWLNFQQKSMAKSTRSRVVSILFFVLWLQTIIKSFYSLSMNASNFVHNSALMAHFPDLFPFYWGFYASEAFIYIYYWIKLNFLAYNCHYGITWFTFNSGSIAPSNFILNLWFNCIFSKNYASLIFAFII